MVCYFSDVLDIEDVETWDKIIAVNLRGTMLCYKYAGQQMIKQGRGGRLLGMCFSTESAS